MRCSPELDVRCTLIGVDLLNVMNLIGLSKVFQILNELIERCVVGSHDDLRDTHLALIADSLSCHTEVIVRIDLKREVGVFVGQDLLAGDCGWMESSGVKT